MIEQTSEQRINLLLNVINTTIKIPKTKEVIYGSGKDKQIRNEPIGNFEISLLNHDEIGSLKNLIIKELISLYPELSPPKENQPVQQMHSSVVDNKEQTKLELEEVKEEG
jgi:hypothetical protein